jgi:membrane associated rhomboid family serine protease
MVLETALRASVLLILAGTIAFVWHISGRGRWRAILTDRFIWGVPWGTLVTVAGIITFYLVVQSGLTHWSDPAVLPFRSWSYAYPLGLFLSGFAHAGPGHLIGNTVGAVVLTPLVEYAWGHYPPRGERETGHSYPPPAPASTANTTPETRPAGAAGLTLRRRLAGFLPERVRAQFARPWVRALVIFPLSIALVTLVTAVFALGWSMGYSGTVFFLLGFALVAAPLVTVVAMVVTSSVSIVLSTLQNPILRATAAPGGPSPPAWAGVNWQAHLLGFLLGVLVALAVLYARGEWPDPGRLAFAAVTVALVRSLWSISTVDGSEFVQWRAPGLIFILGLVFLVVAAVGAEDEPVVGPVTARHVLVGTLAAVVVLLAVPSAATNWPAMADDPVPGEGVTVADYTVTYGEGVPHGRVDSNASGVIVVSERRDIWSAAVSPGRLAHRGNLTVPVGGLGWRETVSVNRTGWRVAGNDSVYAVNVSHDDQSVRAFQSDPKQAQSRVDGRTITVRPTAGEFELVVHQNGSLVGTAPVPGRNESVAAGGLTFFSDTDDDGTRAVFARRDGTQVLIAERN